MQVIVIDVSALGLYALRSGDDDDGWNDNSDTGGLLELQAWMRAIDYI